ncbi:ATP binding cassette subfamily C member 10, partial [Homo sapiens]
EEGIARKALYKLTAARADQGAEMEDRMSRQGQRTPSAQILCIDEATASVDQKTDQLLQQTICKRFANKTVLTIAHRLNTILNSDRVLVLQAGRVVELDSPATLRNQPHSLFQQLLQSSQQGVPASLGGP